MGLRTVSNEDEMKLSKRKTAAFKSQMQEEILFLKLLTVPGTKHSDCTFLLAFIIFRRSVFLKL